MTVQFSGSDMVDVDQDEAYELVIEVATGNLDDVGLIAQRLRSPHVGM
ncbi:hypothetical protein ACFCV8_33345 [Streptomyces sp. NPDC056347]